MKKNVLIIVLLFVSAYSLEAGDQLSLNGSTEWINGKYPSTKNYHIYKTLYTSKLADTLTNIKKINIDGIVTHSSNNIITLDNLRILSDTTDFNDFISVDLMIDASTFKLIPTNIEIINDIGIYYQPCHLFSKDIQNDIEFITPDGNHFSPQTHIKIETTKDDEYTLKMESGTVLSLNIFGITDDMIIKITHPNGSNTWTSGIRKGEGKFLNSIPIFKSGEYKCHFIPYNVRTVSFLLTIINENSSQTEKVNTGEPLEGSLELKGLIYDKYLLSLENGDSIRTNGLGRSLVKYYLIRISNSSIVNWGCGDFIQKIAYTDDYCLFIKKGQNIYDPQPYKFFLEVIPDSNKEKYPIFSNKLGNQTAHVNDTFSLQLIGESNYPIKYGSAGLPAELILNPNSGKISGIPEIAGIFPISVIIVNEYGSDQDDFILNVQGETIDISDTDKDGVIDAIDMCNDTPLNTCVNNKGCPCNTVLLEKNDYVSRNTWRYFTLSVGHKYTSFNVKLYSLEQDLDLYVREGQKPDHDKFACRPFKGGIRAETCNIVNEGDKIWHLGVFGYLEGNFSIKVIGKIN